MDVFSGKSFVDCCALLKEKHPRGHSCANISQHDDQSVLAQTARERFPGNECMTDRVPIRVREQGNGNENEIEYGDSKQGSFPGPITVHYYGQTQEQERTDDRSPRGHAKKSQACTDGNKLGDQRQEIADAQVNHREPAPERAEAVKDQFRMTAMSGGTETHGHLLYDDCHTKRKNNEGNEESNSKPCARRGVGNHARAIVLSKHHENSGSD